MEHKILQLTFFAALSYIFFLQGQIEAFRQPQCRGKPTNLTEEELKIMTDCVVEFGAKSGNMSDIPAKSLGCVGKCVLQRQGLIDNKGVPVKDSVFAIVNATLAPEQAKLADERFGKCIDDNSSGLDVNEKACQTYAPLVTCIAAAFMDICSTNNTST